VQSGVGHRSILRTWPALYSVDRWVAHASSITAAGWANWALNRPGFAVTHQQRRNGPLPVPIQAQHDVALCTLPPRSSSNRRSLHINSPQTAWPECQSQSVPSGAGLRGSQCYRLHGQLLLDARGRYKGASYPSRSRALHLLSSHIPTPCTSDHHIILKHALITPAAVLPSH
jgi:hypothetical protein